MTAAHSSKDQPSSNKHVTCQPRLDAWSMLLLLALAAVWGGSFFFVEIALEALPPMTIVAHRVVWAALFLGCILIVQRQRSLPTGLRCWGAYAVMGLLNNAIPFSLIVWGQVQIESGLASIINGTTALFGAAVAGIVLVDEPLTPKKVIGALLGLGGVGVIMGPGAFTAFDLTNLAQLAILGAALSYAFASVWGKIALKGQTPIVNAFGMLSASATFMIPAAYLAEGAPAVALPAGIWLSLLGLAVLSTAFAYLLYFAILARAGSANLMLVTLLVPPFAVLLGAIFLRERLSLVAWIGFGLIALGLLVTDGRLFRRSAND